MTHAGAVALTWSRAASAEECIDGRELASRVEGVVGREVFAPGGGSATAVDGTVGPAPGGGWEAVVDAKNDGAVVMRRQVTVSGADCRRLDEAVVLVVALMVDSAESLPVVINLPATPKPISEAVGLGVAVSPGMLPGAGVSIGFAGAIAIPPVWPITLWTRTWPTALTVGASDQGGRVGAWTVGAAVCPLWADEHLWGAAACIGGSGGAVSSSGVNLDIPASKTLGYAEVDGRVDLRLRLAGPVFFGVELGAGVPVARYRYRYMQADGTLVDLFRTAAVIPQVGARVEVRVP
ncbi:MAG TPA: hypothetical protein VHV30_16175 [Polyangiaceae bacterium]|nr:hypothetical protein [Polyangiaceae bacterium]